jgi:phospholipid/cholesterol/gamma-HCH transport system substrate-binding protein
MNRNVIETVLGGVVLLSAAVFLTFAYGSADLGKKEGYVVKADFERIDGLKPGSDVRLNGVMVGSVLSIVLNKESYRATVDFSMDEKIKLPRDTMAMIANESLLGGKYLSLEIGVDEDFVKTDGTGRLTRTSPPMRLDDLIGHMIFNKQEEGKKADAPAAAAPASAPASAPANAAPAPAAQEPASPAQMP